jgi:carbonic anhydrase
VRDIVVCGHSSCGAMRALSSGELPAGSEHLARWIAHAEPSKARLLRESRISAAIPDVDRLSRAHVLQQIDHLRAFPAVADGVADGRLTLHAWWFDLANAEVLAYDAQAGDFLPLVEREAVSAVGASS